MRQLLHTLQNENNSNEKLRIVSELIMDFEEDPYPMEHYLVDSLKRVLVAKISAKDSPCYEILSEDSSPNDIRAFEVIEKCIRLILAAFVSCTFCQAINLEIKQNFMQKLTLLSLNHINFTPKYI